MADWYQAIRSLRRSPTFTATAIATLALGIGATSAIFTIVNAALFKPLPYPNPDTLVVLTVPPGRDVAGQMFLYFRDRVQTLESVAAQGGGNGWNLVAGDLVTYTRSSRVSERFFATHGVQLILGREFWRAEDAPGGPDVTVISEALWRRAFAGSPSVLGQTVRLGSAPYTIIGVVPDSFRGIPDVDLWTPLRTTLSDNGQNYRVIGRIRGGQSAAQVASELDGLRPAILGEFPRTSNGYVALLAWMPYREFVGAGMRQTFLI